MTASQVMSGSQKAIGPFLTHEGFTREHRRFVKACGDVLHYFGWTLPRPYEAGYIVSPILELVSRPLLKKVGLSENGGFGSGQISMNLGGDRLNGGWYVRDESDIEAAAASIINAYMEKGKPLLDSCCSTDELVNLMVSRLDLSTRAKERISWEAGVWRGEIDPISQPCVKAPTALDRVPKEITDVAEFVKALRKAEAEMEAEKGASE